MKCEEGGNYVEAGRAQKQLGIIRQQEVRRQQKTIQARHNLERQDIQSAHDKQFCDFDLAWKSYMEGIDLNIIFVFNLFVIVILHFLLYDTYHEYYVSSLFYFLNRFILSICLCFQF